MKYVWLAALFFIPSAVGFAQTPAREHTLHPDEPFDKPRAVIDDIAWLQGHWKGNAFGGWGEEIWSGPADGAMMGMYRAVRADTVWLYEFFTIVEEDSSLILRLKHFHPDLKGWENREQTVDFPLVKISEDTIWFQGLTFKKTDSNQMVIYLQLSREGEAWEEVFNMEKVDMSAHE